MKIDPIIKGSPVLDLRIISIGLSTLKNKMEFTTMN
jgi:hypothetical protein